MKESPAPMTPDPWVGSDEGLTASSRGLGTSGREGGAPDGVPLIQMKGITKRFPGVVALSRVSLEVHRGEVHLLIGENGAGKSTLIKILAGVYPPEEGEVLLEGRSTTIRDPRHAQELGISTIYQELNLIPQLTVAENIFLGKVLGERGAGYYLDRRVLHHLAREALEGFGFDIRPAALVSQLSVAERQLVEITKALSVRNARVLIFDEPTAALTDREVDQLFRIIGELKTQGVGVLYITHRLEELKRVGDRVTVLRDGHHIATHPVGHVTEDELIRLMVGRRLEERYPREMGSVGDVILKAKGLTRRGDFHDVTFEVRAGEILGLAGLIGSGRSELMQALFGAIPLESGRLELFGRPVVPRSPRHSIGIGMSYVPADRKRDGLALILSVNDNVVLQAPDLVQARFFRALFAEHGKVDRLAKRLRIKTPSIFSLVRNLSGGNQQKVVVAKALTREPRVVIFDEPTRGIDVGAKAEVYQIIESLARQGAAVLLVSPEIPELLGICDRILVMARGRISGEFRREEATQEKILRCAFARAD